MARYIIRRLLLAVVTLWLVTAVVFFTTHILPGNVALRILGPFAQRSAIDSLNEELGMNRPVFTQYTDWIGGVLHGDLGTSLKYNQPVAKILFPALVYSLKLAALAFVLLVPLSILGGIVAALNRGKIADRIITIGGLSAAMVPEFVWAVILVLVFGIQFSLFPVTAIPKDGASVFGQIYPLILPAICLVLVLFGYVARITRAGVIEALDADYTRTAVLKGIPRQQVIRKHVLRNALLPTIAVIASQISYLVGGLVAVEIIFNYPGFGLALRTSVTYRDFPMLQASVLVVAAIIVLVQVLADIIFIILNPRIRQKVSN
ncbi:MAG: ABC transporter permease [Ilumatobacteraceae bacterium]